MAKRGNHPTQPYHCLDCKRFFSVKTNSVMHSSKLGYRKWAIAIYLFVVKPKGFSALQLHKELGVTLHTAWHLNHRIRRALESEEILGPFAGPVEVDETWMGGRARNQTLERKLRLRKIPVIGMIDQESDKVVAKPVPSVGKARLHAFIYAHTRLNTPVYTDESRVYPGMRRQHLTVNHSAYEYGLTNRIESFWSLLKRGYRGVYHQMSPKHLHRYVTEFQERHNRRPLSTIDFMKSIVSGGVGKRLTYDELVHGERRAG